MAEILGLRRKYREDEWDIDFNDTRDFLIETWNLANDQHKLKPADRQQAEGFSTGRAFTDFVLKEQDHARKAGLSWKTSALSSALKLARLLALFESLVQDLVVVEHDEHDEENPEMVDVKAIDTSSLWNLAFLNVKLSMNSQIKFKSVSRWMSDLRRNLDLLNSAMRQSSDLQRSDENSIRMEVLEVFDPVISILYDSVVYLQRQHNEEDFARNWHNFLDGKIKESQDLIAATIKHIRDVATNSRIDAMQSLNYASELGMRDRILPMDGSEKAIFPIELLPPLRTEHFTGRVKDIEDIHDWLGSPEELSIRKYHIYGRRGIGKTQIALEYARQHKRDYAAIFWIQCETRASLRQSFAEIATKLELEGADMNTNFDENLLRVLRWLRHTKKKWLLIYDNAERENLLKGYWPTGGTGSMLLTSRSYYNFFEAENRHGETIKVFNDQERKDLLLTLLGKRWQAEHLAQDEMMAQIEVAAIATLLQRTGGLPIAISHAARLIGDQQINPTQTVRRFMELFQDHFKSLPKRHTTDRDPLVHSLDTVWAISFDNLSSHAKTILSCLSQLAPDSILIDLFLPSDQSTLTEVLDFCRTSPTVKGPDYPTQSIQTIVDPSSKLQDALDELVRKGLIKITGRQISIHRTVQEAISFRTPQDLQVCFDSMVSLLFDAFPQQQEGRPLTESWVWCRVWIQHAIQLAYKYKLYTSNRAEDDIPLKGMASTDVFVSLLANCSWYLFEIADYEECLNLIAIARTAATDRTSLAYAHLMNTEGTTHYEMNNLGQSRKAMEVCLEIRQALLPPDHVELAIILANLGNVESAEGNLDAALEYLQQAASIREKIGDNAAVLLAVNYMQIGRVYGLREENTQAYKMYQKCEGILNKKVGRNKFFTAHLQYEYGNLQLKQDEFADAGRQFELARQMAKDFNPLHPLTAAACYKLGCIEFEQDHHKKALNFLSKALDIAEVRSPAVVDGTRARIQWKMAEVMLDDPIGDRRVEGTKLKEEMEYIQREIAESMGVDLRGYEEHQDREKSFDLLVPGYFR